ncbi:MAG: hypothetical protein OXE96_10675 [Gemmatimonadetes bacterium]|nr:hypothetical protein [Gemmatimonadota bacterium]
MVFVDGPEKVRESVTDGAWNELLSLPVKKQPAVGDLVLRLKAEEDRMP